VLEYLLRRVGWSLVVLLAASVITFTIGVLMPANPARMIAGPNAPVSVVNSISHELGLDRPVYVQYWRYLTRALHGDFGRSYKTQQKVLPTILRRFPYTAELALAGLFVEIVIGVSLGVASAVYRGSGIDGASMVFVLLALAVPPFWLGIILLYLFAYVVPVFPLGGATGGAMALVLPALTLGFTGSAYYTRMSRASMLEVLSEDYVRTAHAKGLHMAGVIYKHAFRNALRPIVTMAGLDLGVFMGGVLIIEEVFGWPGIGTLAWQAILNVDIPMIMGTVLFTAVVIVIANTLVDVLYGFIDPRISYAGGGE
jgi:peptide/nickel transport system permease protein